MNFTVNNHNISVGNIEISGGVAASSIFIVGDTDSISLSSAFDTPPESLIIGPFVPLAPQN